KAMWQAVDNNPWGLGIVVGLLRHVQQEEVGGWENPYVVVPLSFRPGGLEGTLVHVNLGWLHDRLEHRDKTLWGLAFGALVGQRVTLLGEAFGENANRPFLRFGGRFNAIKDQLDFDLTFVTRSGGTRDERFISVGLYWQTGRVLP